MTEVQQEAQSAYLAGDYCRAVTLFQETIQGAPHNPAAWQGMGYALYACKRMPEAVDAFRESLLLSGGTADGHFGLAMSLCAIGDDIGAAKELEATLALKSDHPAARKGLAVTLVRAARKQLANGQLSICEELLNKAYKHDRHNSDVVLALVDYYRHVKLHNEAAEVVRQAMEDVPHMPGIHDLAAEFGLQKQKERGWLY